MQLNIVLVEPEIPQNTGNIARTCAATGSRLHIVKPMGFTIDDRKLKRAGLDYWHLLDITYYENLADFLRRTQAENFLFFNQGGAHSFGCSLSQQRLHSLRQGDKGTARGASARQPGQVRENTDDKQFGRPQPESLELRRRRRIRSFAPMGISRAADKRQTDKI